MMFVVTGNNSI